METHQNTKELLTAAATLWAAHHTARAAAPNGQLRPTGWLKLIWSHRKILAAGLTGLSRLPAEAADFTAAELDDLYESFLTALQWAPTADTRDRFAAFFITFRDLYTNALRLKNTFHPPKAELAP